ncbi:methyltransferase domain-containing protein [Radiomyces spectabilis]|uniref:methyltransferase domain-containing protein n=1 Tax=Radiomyces spectabilis TaxID=64574 RepID=UPI00221E8915|nr:methyltransferase domain-containing protein [Radiomyces spectabilis]KAI8393825.1 methyltransferase domain-containing protein [Radiomyces spectabilis]
MNALIEQIARKQHVASVVDLGAGQGYLSRALAYQHRLKVLAVDSSEVQTCGAKKFNAKAMKGGKAFDLHHVTDTIGPENASNILSRWSTHSDEHWLLCGLHACGDLSSLMLQLFAESEEMVALVSVGCCYHFLTEEGEHNGFPMSRALKSTDYRLGSTARMLACQAPSRWLDKKDDSLKAYEHHFFRALLQLIMVEKELAKASAAPVIGRLNKKKDFTSFPVYVKAALARLNIPEDSITQEEASRYYQEYKEKQVDKQMAIFWTIRALLAPVLESIVLMDRWLYLKESLNPLQSATKGVWMWPLFDPIISPRNMVIVATK